MNNIILIKNLIYSIIILIENLTLKLEGIMGLVYA